MNQLTVKKLLAYVFLILSIASLSSKWLSFTTSTAGSEMASEIYSLANGDSWFNLSDISDQLYKVGYIIEDGGISISEGKQIISTLSKAAKIVLDYDDDWGFLGDDDIAKLKMIKFLSPLYKLVYWGTIIAALCTLICHLLKRKIPIGISVTVFQCIFACIVIVVINSMNQWLGASVITISYGMFLGIASSIASSVLWLSCLNSPEFSTTDIDLKTQISGIFNRTKNVDYKNISNTFTTTLGDTKPQPVICPNCGHPFAANGQFCSKCGTKKPE